MIVFVLYTLFAIIFLALWGEVIELGKEKGDFPISWNLIWLGVVIAYTLTSITGTGLSERGMKFLLNKLPISEEIPPQALTFVPLGLFTLRTVSVDVQEIELPGESEQIWRGRYEDGKELILGFNREGKETPPPKKIDREGKEITLPWIQAIRATFDDLNPNEGTDPLEGIAKLPDMPDFRLAPGTPDKNGELPEEEAEDPATKRVTVEVRGTLLWRPRELASFWRTFETSEKAENVLRKIAITEMTNALQIGNLARNLANQELLGLYITQKIRERIEHKVVYEDKTGTKYPDHPKGKTPEPTHSGDCRRGVEIMGFLLRPPELSHALNEGIQGILMGKAEAGKTRRTAEGARAKLELEGLGERQRLEHLAKGQQAVEKGKIVGRKEGYATLKRLGITPSEILTADTARQIAENVGNLFVTDGKTLTAVVGALAAGKEVLSGQPPSRPSKKKRQPVNNASGSDNPPLTPPPAANP
ncbi:MAG: hypothetical protein V1704_00835 [Candidatus Vogelbacteria bacterium]